MYTYSFVALTNNEAHIIIVLRNSIAHRKSTKANR